MRASSFVERINSAGNQVLTKGNSVLATDEINMLVVLRMNRSYMAYMRENHPEVAGQQFQMTLVSTSDNAEQGDAEDTA